jgi:hypothetical protein
MKSHDTSVSDRFYGQQFGRRVRLAVGDRSLGDTQGTELEGYRVAFEVEKVRTSKPNNAKIQVFGTSDTTADKVFAKGVKARLSAGYPGTEALIFFGEIVSSSRYHTGPTAVLDLELQDSAQAMKESINQAWTRGTSFAVIVKSIAAAMGLSVTDSTLAKITGGTRYSYAAHGLAFRDLNLITASLGVGWTVEGGELVVLQPGQANNRLAVLATSDTGLVGTVTPLEPTKKRKLRRVSFQMLLNSRLHAGALVDLRSERVTGLFRLDRALHVGDTHGGDFTTTCEGTETQ